MEAVVTPLWLKLAFGASIVVIVVVYWREYGPSNFLWLSDLALFLTGLAVIIEHRLPASMVAVGVLPLELAWTADFLAGGRLMNLAGYMFDRRYSLFLRALSLFHLAIPPTIIWMLVRFGYDGQAVFAQLIVTWAALVTCYLATDPAKNINWVFGPGTEPQKKLPPLQYFALVLAIQTVAVVLPMHFLLTYLFGTSPA
jgi:hypothetical protein